MQELDLFAAAIAIADPAERARFLQRECAEQPELQERIERLLAAHFCPLSSVDPVDVNHLPFSPGIEETRNLDSLVAGAVIAGRFTLLEPIGEGGMGQVWVAQQNAPVKRKVAVKLIKAGMDSRAVLARFEAERQALAVMDHPHIAKVLDGGTTAEGRPFFVMELVRGIPITEYCDQVQYSVRERLELFVQVCSAVQHAHQKGIIHRDLKPSNILVTEHDGRPVCKVIDFGLAKALHGAHALTDISLHTSFGAVIGTPLYMAPEQLGTSALDMDTRSDLYSLGVILYELLTGTTPIERQRLKEAAWDEIRRIVREEEPPRPSLRLSSSESLSGLAARRHVDPTKLTSLVRGELDWIIMKALEKDRNRRYETANSLALDIQRHLAGEAVLAAPSSRAYRLRKFVRRHRGPVIAGSLLLLALLAGIAGTTWGLLEAREAAAAERVARIDAQKERKESEKQRARAELREQEAIDAVKRFRDAVANNPELKNTPQFESLRNTLLKEPLAYFRSLRDRLLADGDTRPQALARLARAAYQLGLLTREIGQHQDALRALEEARAIWERLARENSSVTDFQRDLAITLNDIGLLLRDTGERADALSLLDQAKAILERLVLENPTATDFQRELALTVTNIGNLLLATGKQAEALGAYEQARAIQDRLTRKNPTVTDFQHDLALTFTNIGVLLSYSKPMEALAAYEQAKAILERLARENPTDTNFQRALARTYFNIGALLRDTGKTAEALAECQHASQIQEQLARENPTVTDFQSELATTYNGIGALLRDTGKPAEALAAFKQAKATHEQLIRENPTATDFERDLARTYINIGTLLSETGNPGDALAAYQQATEIQERLMRKNPTVTNFQSSLAKSYYNMGVVLSQTGKSDEALAANEQAKAILERLALEHRTVTEYRIQLGATLNNMAMAHLKSQRLAEGRNLLQEAIAHQRSALADNPQNPLCRQFLKNHYSNLLTVANDLGDVPLAAEARRGLAELAADDGQVAAVDQRMVRVLAGDKPKSAEELLQFGQRAYDTQRFALAARFFNNALTSDASLAENRQTQVAYNAACSAALGAAGQGVDDPPLDDTAKAQLRSQALAWLQQELERWTRFVEATGQNERQLVVQTLTHWQNDPDLIAVRGEAIEQLAESEQEAWRALWTAVDQLRAKTTETPSEPKS